MIYDNHNASGPAPSHGVVSLGDLGVAEAICVALNDVGISTAFPIQTLTLPIAFAGHDVIGQARTGSGKTLAFGIPLLQRVGGDPGRIPAAPRSLVVVPTRELALQVADDLRAAGAKLDVSVVTLYGGRAYEPQVEALQEVDIVVGTPGRLLDLCRQGQLKLDEVAALVVDEADKMLDLGFLPDVEAIVRRTPDDRQTMLFSATMPGEVVTLARRYMRHPTHIRAEHQNEPLHVPEIEQHVFRAHQLDKIEMLARVLQADGRGLAMVFCRTKRSAGQLAGNLAARGFAVAEVHGDLGQGERERAMRAFRSGRADVLVATEVAARGLDVDNVTHVVNFECPDDAKAFLHRVGRTGRAGRPGIAVTFVDWSDLARWKTISDALGLDRADPPETYSTSAHLYAELGIPAGTTGRLRGTTRTRGERPAVSRPAANRPAGSSQAGSRQTTGRQAASRQDRGMTVRGDAGIAMAGGRGEGTRRARTRRRRLRANAATTAGATTGGATTVPTSTTAGTAAPASAQPKGSRR